MSGRAIRRRQIYLTFAVTEALAVRVKVQLAVSLPPLEHAPDQTTVRPLVALKVIELFVAKLAEAVLPTATLMPAGLDSTFSPLRPVALTVRTAFALGAASVSVAL